MPGGLIRLPFGHSFQFKFESHFFQTEFYKITQHGTTIKTVTATSAKTQRTDREAH